MSEFRDHLSASKPIFILPRDDAAGEVISPAFSVSKRVSIMMGFFSSGSFSEIAPGLAQYLRSSEETLRLIVSPFISKQDQEALQSNSEQVDSVVEKLFEGVLPNAHDLASHTLSCLAWLITKGRLELKVAVMRDALFHPKVWIFESGADCVVLHGSANMTGHGLGKNREQLSLAKSWKTDDGAEICATLVSEFETLWSGGDEHCVIIPISDALREKIVREYKGERQPDEKDFLRIWRRAHGLDEEPIDVERMLDAQGKRSFEIPDWIEYQSGEYAHQGQAVGKWLDAGCRGILEMCTGSGKTLTAMICAHHLYALEKRLLIVVSAPYDVLISQWCDEIAQFGIKPINMSRCAGPRQRALEIVNARRRLRKGVNNVEALVVSNDTLCTAEFIDQISEYDGSKLLIADECHNLGAQSFISNPPECFNFRLGLSATPVRQYDSEGTEALFKFFGKRCFCYALEQAIGHCLTPYDYHVDFVELNDDEMDSWREISEKIAKLSWKVKEGVRDTELERLLLKRRRILETAASKISVLEKLLDAESSRDLKYTLVYATDKDPSQLESVNSLLRDKGIRYHQLTSDETGRSQKASRILSQFQSGSLQVLTAKRVLDEGVNVPQIMKAYILASTTVERQWVQRRGRLLRTCKDIGKQAAVIHDLVTLPPGAIDGGVLDNDAKKIVNSELNRVWEFARLSRNGASKGGPFDAVEKLRGLLGEG
ncbi:DEAD/DEAH box helicase family protein [Thalassospira sp. UBA848]|uniref:DEAD/DEAH box helicase family protein n=1 Tax=Thalassospira sp. UBA848 TaxID=1947677 RepID=UPI0026015586|nr:DEAD/DEAH box helicase family protein [Thalassospira sp. UBA848]